MNKNKEVAKLLVKLPPEKRGAYIKDFVQGQSKRKQDKLKRELQLAEGIIKNTKKTVLKETDTRYVSMDSMEKILKKLMSSSKTTTKQFNTELSEGLEGVNKELIGIAKRTPKQTSRMIKESLIELNESIFSIQGMLGTTDKKIARLKESLIKADKKDKLQLRKEIKRSTEQSNSRIKGVKSLVTALIQSVRVKLKDVPTKDDLPSETVIIGGVNVAVTKRKKPNNITEWTVNAQQGGQVAVINSPGGEINHAKLENLIWTDSEHIGTADTFAGFDSSGDATEYAGSYFDGRYAKLDLTNQPFKPLVNSTTAFQIQQADSTPVFNVDTTNAITSAYGRLIVDGVADEIQSIIQAHSTQTANILEVQDSAGTSLAGISPVGNLAIGTATVADIAVKTRMTGNGTAASGGSFQLVSGATGYANLSGVSGNYAAYTANAQTGNYAPTAVSATVQSAFSFTTAEVSGIKSTLSLVAVGNPTVTKWNGILVNTPTIGAGGTLGSGYGLYVEDISGATTSNYAIYTNAGLVNFGDQVKIDGSQDIIQSITQAHSTQTANISEIQLSDTTVTGGWDKVGTLFMKETTTPTATTNYGKVYTKSDNKLYFQDGAGTEHEIAFV